MADTNEWSLENDLDFIVQENLGALQHLVDANLFLTGGTGFIGCWLLETLCYANIKLALNLKVTILTRSYVDFMQKAPHLAGYPAFTFIEGDICNFTAPDDSFTHIIHAATDASAQLNAENPLKMFNTIVQGTRNILDFATKQQGAKILFLSSGAVYGQQPWEVERIGESWQGAPSCLDAKAAYAEGKRAAEMLCALYAKQFQLHVSIARIFAVLGPYLALGTHFAAGNFIKDAMQGKPVIVNGNGLPCRSYLYAADLTIWLLHILLKGKANTAYNVGSDESVSIKQLAERTAHVLGTGEYKILGADDQGWNLGRYVPDTSLIRQELGMKQTVSLDDAIKRTALWHGWQGNNP